MLVKVPLGPKAEPRYIYTRILCNPFHPTETPIVAKKRSIVVGQHDSMEKTLSGTGTHLEDSPPSTVDDSPKVDDFDIVDKSAIGGRDTSELPPKYYSSLEIIGSVIVRAPTLTLRIRT